MMRLPSVGLLLVAALGLAACVDHPSPVAPESAASLSQSQGNLEFTGRYVLLSQSWSLPANLAAQVKSAGGQLVNVFPEIGVAVAEPVEADFAARAARIRGIASVTPDFVVPWADPPTVRDAERVALEDEIETTPGSLSTPFESATFYPLQWAPRAVNAPDAWAAGYTGKGVRVAILDGAIYDQHQDLGANLDVDASRSFVPGFAYNQDTGTFWHGTHVAGIVAARGVGAVGIAPEATLIGVKVLHSGSGAWEWILNGIMHAATPLDRGGAGAHIINMSLGATFDYRTNWNDKAFRDAVRELTTALDRATRHAYQQGVTVIAAAGNSAINLDVVREAMAIPAQSQHVISVSATGPHGWALGATDFERPAYYSSFGKSLVDLSGPGGTAGLFVVDGFDGFCIVAGILHFCETFDLVLNTSRGTMASGGYSWAQGTSMAAPLVSGVAALIIEKAGGSLHPAQVRTALQRSTLHLGKRGNDEFYGHGWVNAGLAVQ